MSNVVHWLKANVFIVVFVLLMIAAAIGLPLVASSMNTGVREEVETRAKNYSDLINLRTTPVIKPSAGTPGEPVAALVNNSLLLEYEKQVEDLSKDASLVRDLAIQFNRKGRGVLMENVFPSTPQYLRDETPGQFHKEITAAYQRLLDEIGAGSPRDRAEIEQAIAAEQGQFLAAQINKLNIDLLTPEEKARLHQYLTMRRLALYVDHAKQFSLYAGPGSIDRPDTSSGMPSWGELFNWQWAYWIYEDVLRGLASANEGSESVLDAPVKRVEWLTWTNGLPTTFRGNSGSGVGRAGFGGGTGGTSGSTQATPAGVAPDFTVQTPTDFTASFTGRVTNPLYDVVFVQLNLVVDAVRLPEVIDALSRRNFITVIDVDLTPRDAFEDVAQGYVYGETPVASVQLMLETVWLREWTTEFMPDDTRSALNVPLPQAPASETAEATETQG